LTEEQARTLLDHVDVVRDPVHGDVHLTALERWVIDRPEFQRLRNVAQLGLTVVAYPGALHNRFLHSIGTLHVGALMISTCNANASLYSRLAADVHPVPLRLTSYQVLLARFCCLVHDLAHVPFGHTLEKEGRVFNSDEWHDTDRANRLFGDDAGFAAGLREFFQSHGLPPDSADGLRKDARTILTTPRNDIHTLRYPFVHDLVGNTICADLIDYVRRDMYFCGLREVCGDRFLEFVAIVPLETNGDGGYRTVKVDDDYAFATRQVKKKLQLCRVVLLQYRYNERRAAVVKHGVVTEAVDLIRRRLALAEKVYFHRTKIIASSMLISAAYEAGLTARDIWELSDREVLKHLANSTQPRVKALATKILERHLLKPIYHASYHERDASEARHDVDVACERFREPRAREDLARRLERCIALAFGISENDAAGTVSIYCPDSDMNVKAFDMLVLPHPRAERIRRLQDTEHPPTQLEIKAIFALHNHLWRLEVFVDPTIVPLDDPSDQRVRRLAGAIQREIGPRNELEGFHDVEALPLEEWERQLTLDSVLEEIGLGENITNRDYKDLARASFNVRGDRGELVSQVREWLRSRGYRA